MPPKKADHQRKSDVSAARFALKEDGHDADATASPDTTTNDNDNAGTSASPPQQQQAGSESGKKGSVAPEGGKASAPASPSEKKEGKDGHRDAVTIEDLSLPKSIITRLAKGVLPANTQIQANAVLALSKSTTVFISHLAAAANEHTVNAGKKTILPADVFKALEDTEFGFLKESLEAEFKKFTTVQTEKRTSYRNKVKAAKADTSTQDADMTDAADTTTASAGGPDADGSAPRSKKARIEGAAAGAGVGAGAAAAAAAAADEHDDAETEDDDEHVHDDDEDQDQEDDDEEDEDDAAQDDDETREHSGDETQDALEGRTGADEHDEALDGDESD